MSIRMKSVLLILGAIILCLGFLAACSLPGGSMKGTIEDFILAVNDRDAGGLKDTLDPDAAAYNQAADNAWIITHFPATDYEISKFVSVGNTATVVLSSDSLGELPLTFEMTEEKGSFLSGSTYTIRKIKLTGTSVYFFE